MASSPYAHVPAAATTLARRLQPVLNAARAKNGLAPVPLLRVDRISTSAGDYGTLSAQARDLHMAANILSFRRFRPAQVRDAHLLVVDDVRVTGAHQRCLMRASEDLPLAARTFLYIAAFPGQLNGCFDPAQEDALNHAAVKTLDDLAGIVEADDFAWNVRVCKFVLSPANQRRAAAVPAPHARLVRPRPVPQQLPGRLRADDALCREPCRRSRGTERPGGQAARCLPARNMVCLPGAAPPPGAGGGPLAGLTDARHARPVAAALVASGAFTADLRHAPGPVVPLEVRDPCPLRLQLPPPQRRPGPPPPRRRRARRRHPLVVPRRRLHRRLSPMPGSRGRRRVAERLDLPLAYVRAEARKPGGPLVECSPRPGSPGRHHRGRRGERRQRRAGHPRRC